MCHPSMFSGSSQRSPGVQPPLVPGGIASDLLSSTGASEGPTPKCNHHLFEHTSNDTKGFYCNGCGEAGFGPRYLCMQAGCREDLHVECRVRKLDITHELIEGSTFTLIDKNHNLFEEYKAKPCKACGQSVARHFYHEEENVVADKRKSNHKGRNLHPYCAHLRPERWATNRNLMLKDKASSRCVWCDQKHVTDKEPGWSYEYKEGGKKCNIHVHCVMVMAQAAWKDGTQVSPLDDAVLTAAKCFGKRNAALSAGKKYHEGILWDVVKALAAGLLKIVFTIGVGPHGAALADAVIQKFL